MKNSSFILFVLALICGGCRTRTSSGASSSGGGYHFSCKFALPDHAGDFFTVSGLVGQGSLSQVKTELIIGGVLKSQSKDTAKVVEKDILAHKWDLKLEQHTPKSREIRNVEKGHFVIDHNNYSCFDIAGTGPRNEDYFCMHKSLQIGKGQVLWVSDFRYAKDLNVVNIQGDSCK